jgi:hypothetical protein
MLSRRSMLALSSSFSPLLHAAEPTRLRPRSSREIEASPLGIGFETLDRKQYDPERCYDRAGALGVKWARCQTGWARTETSPGVFDFAWLDSVVDNLRSRGIEPWLGVSYGNRLYTKEAPHESAVGWAPVFSDEQKRAWVRYVTALARQYRGRVKAFEIWNEPNIDHFWQPGKPSPADYVELVKLTAPVLRKVIPDAVLVGGALAGLPQSLDFLDGCLSLGLGRMVDKISYHPYRAQPEAQYVDDVRGLRGLIARHRPAGMGIWQGENGAPSFGGGEGALSNLHWTEDSQARWLLRRLLLDLHMGAELTSYFLIVDIVNYVRKQGATGLTNPKGVLRGNTYEPKPSYFALQNLCTLFDAQTRREEILCRVQPERHDVFTSSFLRGKAPLFVFWAASNLQQQEPFVPPTGTVVVRPDSAMMFAAPVLVDLKTGTVRSLPGEPKGGFWTFPKLPVPDWPVVITDRSVVA